MSDLQPKPFKVTIQEKSYFCKPPRMSHRLIIGRVQPLFKAAQDISEGKQTEVSAKDMLQYEEDIDTLVQSLVPELKGVTLDIMDIADFLGQLLDQMIPEDSKELKDANIEVNSKDPKVPSEAKS